MEVLARRAANLGFFSDEPATDAARERIRSKLKEPVEAARVYWESQKNSGAVININDESRKQEELDKETRLAVMRTANGRRAAMAFVTAVGKDRMVEASAIERQIAMEAKIRMKAALIAQDVQSTGQSAKAA